MIGVRVARGRRRGSRDRRAVYATLAAVLVGFLISVGAESVADVAWTADDPSDDASPAAPTSEPSPPSVRDVIVTFEAADGTPMEAKLSVPGDADGPVPVVFWLHGAGIANYDVPFRYVDDTGTVGRANHLDYHARELARRGIAFFRMSKRGCTTDAATGALRVDRAAFLALTIDNLLDDYAAGLDALRRRTEIDPTRIALLGVSEGTRVAPRLALRSPDGIHGVALIGYAEDSAEEIVTWQLTHGPWRGIQHAIPAARDGMLTRAEYDEALAADPSLAARVAFAALDGNGDRTVTPEEVAEAVRPLREAVLRAVEEGNDELLWARMGNIGAVYLRSWWDAEPNSRTLVQVPAPVLIVHGAFDNTTRVEGVDEAVAVFAASGRNDLEVFIDPDGDHGVNLDWRAARGAGPPGYVRAFGTLARWLNAGDGAPRRDVEGTSGG